MMRYMVIHWDLLRCGRLLGIVEIDPDCHTFYSFLKYFYLVSYSAAPGLHCGMRNLFLFSFCFFFFCCGIWTLCWGVWHLVPWPGIEPQVPCFGSRVLTIEPPWKSHAFYSHSALSNVPISYRSPCLLLSKWVCLSQPLSPWMMCSGNLWANTAFGTRSWKSGSHSTSPHFQFHDLGQLIWPVWAWFLPVILGVARAASCEA